MEKDCKQIGKTPNAFRSFCCLLQSVRYFIVVFSASSFFLHLFWPSTFAAFHVNPVAPVKTPCSFSVCLLFRCQRKYVKNQQGVGWGRSSEIVEEKRIRTFLIAYSLQIFMRGSHTHTHMQFSYIQVEYRSSTATWLLFVCAVSVCMYACLYLVVHVLCVLSAVKFRRDV